MHPSNTACALALNTSTAAHSSYELKLNSQSWFGHNGTQPACAVMIRDDL